jgi:hypothetical protein
MMMMAEKRERDKIIDWQIFSCLKGGGMSPNEKEMCRHVHKSMLCFVSSSA